MKSFAGETVDLIDKIQVEEKVEIWLNELTIGMQATLQDSLYKCLQEPSPVKLKKYPS